jgi:predicted membrane channel-forming protein YqfA (hemolysin III family)
MKYNLNINDVPYYLHYNKVTSGYRKGGNYKECLKSMFTSLHNETVNAFTSLINSVISIYCLYYSYINDFYITPIFIWSFGITLNSLMSFGFHTFSPIDKNTFNLWRNLDVNSIYISSFLQCLSFSMICLPKYLFNVNILYLIVIFTSILKFVKHTPEKHLCVKEQSFNIFLYLINLIFCLIYYSLNNNITYYTHIYIILIITTLFLTGFLYVLRIPERFFKQGTFNKIGHSHNIMHIGITLFFIFEFLFFKEYNLNLNK